MAPKPCQNLGLRSRTTYWRTIANKLTLHRRTGDPYQKKKGPPGAPGGLILTPGALGNRIFNPQGPGEAPGKKKWENLVLKKLNKNRKIDLFDHFILYMEVVLPMFMG